MSHAIVNRVGLAAVLLSLGGMGPGCAHRAASRDETARVAQTRGEIQESDRIRATIERIDPAAHVVQLRDEQGRSFAVEAGDAALARVAPGDQIEVKYQESVAFALKDPRVAGGADDTKVRESTEQTGTGEVQFGRQVTTTVQILTVSPEGSAVEFRVPDGPVRSVAIADTESRKKIANLRPGDAVEVTYTEKLALAVDEAAH